MNIPERIKQIGISKGKKIKDPKFNKTNPIEYIDFEDVEKWMKNKVKNKHAWKVKIDELEDYNLELKNPNEKTEKKIFSAHELMAMILKNNENITKKFNKNK